jgi:hypothetical protein
MTALKKKPDTANAARQGRHSLDRLVRRFRWKCDDCRTSGVADITLPMQVRELHQRLEESHAKKHPYTACPSDYFEVTEVTPNRQSGATDAPAVRSHAGFALGHNNKTNE